MTQQSVLYVPGPTPSEYDPEYIERELRGVSDLFQRLTRAVYLSSFSFHWDPGVGLDLRRTVNVTSVTAQGGGVYRILLTRTEQADIDLSQATLPLIACVTPSKTDEGTVTPIYAGSGMLGGQDYFDQYLSETYVQGNSLRERAYTLVTGDVLYGMGFMPPTGA